MSDGQWLWWCWYRGVTVKCRFLFHLKISVFHWHLCNKTNYHTFTYDMYDFVYAIQMVKVSPYHSPCNNNAVSHGGVIIRHYYYMGCDTAKLAAGNFAWNRVFSFSQLFWFKKKKKKFFRNSRFPVRSVFVINVSLFTSVVCYCQNGLRRKHGNARYATNNDTPLWTKNWIILCCIKRVTV